MPTINDTKQLAEADSPILFFECRLASGAYQRWSTHALSLSGNAYAARVLKHNLFDLQLSAEDAMDGLARLSLTLANADSLFSQIESQVGWKGAELTVYFAFANLLTKAVTTESTVLFRGIAGDPDEITEETLRLSFANKLSLQRVALPEVRIQRRCPWTFPTNAAQRAEAVSGGANGKYSKYFRCGYSADQEGGHGNLNAGQPFTTCDLTRASCEQRGMFRADSLGRITSRFGGVEFVPSSTLVRGHGEKESHLSTVTDNTAKYNDYVPLVYGTGWLRPPIIFARNDGNLTHMEVLLGVSKVQSVLKVVVSGVEIPAGVAGLDMTATGWYQFITAGDAQGAFNVDFRDANGNPLGDPYGSMSVLSVIVPNRINDGRSLPHIEVLLQGQQLDRYLADGGYRDTTHTNNPAWVILDILRRAGWPLVQLHLPSFAAAASYCEELISTTDLHGNPIQVPRFQCNLLLTKRRSAAEIVRGIRVGAGLMLRYGTNGLLELLPETTIAKQQIALPDGSNSTEALAGGWPAYEFSDSSGPFSGIVRKENCSSSVRLLSRSAAETPNRLTIEFQDEANEYQQDSLSVVDADDVALVGYETSNQSTALGIPNFNQAMRVLSRQLNKMTRGNRFLEFETGFRALKVRPGDIITLTYGKEGFNRVPLRVVKLSPSMNYRRVVILAQVHNDTWYSDDPSVGGGGGRQPGASLELPKPLLGTTFDAGGNTQFNISERITERADGSATATLRVSFAEPAKSTNSAPVLPLLSLAPQINTSAGSLPGGKDFYYAVSAVDASGREGALSFTVRAAIPNGSSTNTVTLTGLSFPANSAAFYVYRGATPQLLYRIASQVALGSTFSDGGLNPQPIGPPDPNFDHANFYYRLEIAGPFLAEIASSTTIGNPGMGATDLAYAGSIARIISGTGEGQERKIITNNATTLTVAPPWTTVPDATSTFVVAEASWRFGAVSATSPAEFEVPNQAGMILEISGRAANVHDRESSLELAPPTRWVVGGGPGNTLDRDIPGSLNFTVEVPGKGVLTLRQIEFGSLVNTRSIQAGTLQAIYWNELLSPTLYQLATAVNTASGTLTLNAVATPELGDVIQIEHELMTVVSFNAAAKTYQVLRGSLGSTVAAHAAGSPVYHLEKRVFIAPFARDFFEGPSVRNYSHSISLPDVRVAAAQFFMTNLRGDSETRTNCYSGLAEDGLRTLSGGQFSLQVSGYLAIQQNVAPPLLIEASHAVRDVVATVTEAPSGTPVVLRLWQDATPYCDLTIPVGSTTSNVVSGAALLPLLAGAQLRLDVVSVGQAWDVSPGRNLTVTARL